MKILFVCTGNTCRSSMAEGLMKKIAAEVGLSDVEISSAGTAALAGDAASREAIAVMQEEGIDISSHSARELTRSMIADADFIFTMTRRHRDAVLHMAPEAAHKVFVLKEFAAGIPADQLKRRQELLDAIDEKKLMFLARQGSRLESLRKRQQEIYNELKEIEEEIQNISREFEHSVAEEKRQLLELPGEENMDISDPFGLPVEEYRKTAQELRDALYRVAKILKRKAEN